MSIWDLTPRPFRTGTAFDVARHLRKLRGPLYPLGKTADRHRELEAEGHLVHRGKNGTTIFDFNYRGY